MMDWRVVLMFALGLASASCAFPSVEYEDVQPQGQACVVPTNCRTAADVCRKQADSQQMMCLSKCKTACDTCTTEYDSDLGVCAAQCDSCSASGGCMGAAETCKALVGAP